MQYIENRNIKNKKTLSYSSLSNYNECSFRFLMANVLNLNPYEETFLTIVGNMYHHILEIGLLNEIDVDKEIELFLAGKEFTNKEKFFLKKLTEDLKFTLEEIRKQAKNISLDNYLFEKNWGYGNLLNNFDIRAVNSDSVYLGWNDIKWYDYEDVNAIVYGLKYLEENDYSYRFARLGEDYDDYEEKYYDSDSEKENHLEFPSVLREFEDEYIMDLMKVNDNLEK